MKATELRELSADELRAKSQELRSERFNLEVKHATGQLEDTARLRSIRRDVARVETVLSEKSGASK